MNTIKNQIHIAMAYTHIYTHTYMRYMYIHTYTWWRIRIHIMTQMTDGAKHTAQGWGLSPDEWAEFTAMEMKVLAHTLNKGISAARKALTHASHNIHDELLHEVCLCLLLTVNTPENFCYLTSASMQSCLRLSLRARRTAKLISRLNKPFGKISYEIRTYVNGKSARLCFFPGQLKRR